MSEKAEKYIQNQTARHVLALIIKDVKSIGGEPNKDDISAIVKRIERVREGLIGI